MSVTDPHASTSAWLAIVGIGADGEPTLTAAARAAISAAECVFGGRRQLELVQGLVRGEARVWPTPFADGITQVLARRGRSTCVLASGDPFWFGVGATLAPQLERGEFSCYPTPSSLSLAAARLGWALQDTDVVSLHGRELSAIVRYLQRGRRVLALSWNRETPRALAELLEQRGFGRSQLHVLEALGSAEERVREASAHGFSLSDIADLNLIGIELAADAAARVLPVRGSLPDDWFEHDGQLTKQDVRAITLSALAPRAGERLWDIGAGAGSIAIEWSLSHPTCRAIALEQDATRCERIARNARTLGASGLQVVHACAPEGLSDLPAPDAVFIGGGARDRSIFEQSLAALRRGGRLVINAVSLEGQAELMQQHAAHGGELRRIAMESASALGATTGLRPAFAVLQWRLTKS
ncbi:MAG TPA: precorrin-6y C5,15-methyltransferase (decarboxylating) subunit CbiE [Polyangiales bacterium]|nr:precorrin-6y C5,15-methyltransferase (decarboxylating) subunit CbiE [Polyangiales bacterium]